MNIDLLLSVYEKFNENSALVFSLIAQNEPTEIGVIRDMTDLEVRHFNATLGTLRKWNLIEKNDDGLYQLTSEGKAIISDCEIDEVEETDMTTLTDNTVVETQTPTTTTTTETPEQKETPKTEYTLSELGKFEKQIIKLTKNHLIHTRTDTSKSRCSVRFSRNEFKIRAFELFTKGTLRIYAGGELTQPLHDFVMALNPTIKEGTHWYYDLTLDQFDDLIKFFGK
ncbi:hypothetical protein V4F87_003290 [Vibrio parahaemolyticus]|nr:hypothetical protein [Vibrio parahaemolyticus]